jgi:DNA-directed RNA polymerase specialized sigma subunit
MIRTNAEYEDAQRRLDQDRRVMSEQRAKLEELRLTPAEVERALEPSLSFHEQLREEVEAYEKMRRGDITPIENLMEIGRVLVGLRIAQGITQRELADRLRVSETQVSRDERNDYHGITVERAQRIIQALKAKVRLAAETVEDDEFAHA